MLAKILIWYLIVNSGFFFCVGRGTSMENTFNDGQVLVLKEVTAYSQPEVGDIVTFNVEKMGKIIKRVVAVPGDQVEVRNHQLVINGQPTGREGYVDKQEPKVLADGYVYVVGDSYWSVDSRFLGPIPAEIIEDIFVVKLPIVMPPR